MSLILYGGGNRIGKTIGKNNSITFSGDLVAVQIIVQCSEITDIFTYMEVHKWRSS